VLVDSGRDIYADLQRIEERGKRKKKKFFPSLIDREKNEEEPEPLGQEKEAVQPSTVRTEPEKPAEPQPAQAWTPLTGRKKARAEGHLREYRIVLGKAYKAGRLTKGQCQMKLKKRKIELGLRPPE
jgi:hypothetical protein